MMKKQKEGWTLNGIDERTAAFTARKEK